MLPLAHAGPVFETWTVAIVRALEVGAFTVLVLLLAGLVSWYWKR